ncbi:hypothetical protein NONO_c62760 [Nocardia nova SH22a]|uniref:Secreted protein n=1 Tax=Nocardia nova SH22a TaxID=1415166 RepID=W5TV55_9NOCA|nr:hypothetical protein NONO_c62760 [Nocardia nova SH22a]
MIHRPRVRSLIVAVSGAALLALGSGLLTAAPVNAAPAPAAPDPEYPLGGNAEHPGKPEKDPQAEKAEKLGGGTASDLIDMGADLLKCGLNVVIPSVRCD